MGKLILSACFCTSLCMAGTLAFCAQDLPAYPNYVVIGAFANHRNAVNFTAEANRFRHPAKFEMNRNRKLYYVYVLMTDDRSLAFSEALRFRTQSKYWDTWVFSGPLGSAILHDGVPARDFNPATGEEISAAGVDHIASRQGVNRSSAAFPVRADEQPQQAETVIAVSPASYDANSQTVNDPQTVKPPARNLPVRAGASVPLTAEEAAAKKFYFLLTRADNGAVVEGEVDAVDVEGSRKMATYHAHQPVKVVLPSGGSKQVTFICQVFGYRKQQVVFDPATPAGDFFVDVDGNLVVPFELVRLQKGDIAIMYNVFFFKDAAVMRPESRYEVNNLRDLLAENPSYRIRIHGHTNGNASGKIIRKGESGNFYSLSGTRQGFGSAKKLSQERAEVIRQFLVSSGVAEERMEVKAWGGRKPIHDKHSVRAVENVRVEIEILSD